MPDSIVIVEPSLCFSQKSSIDQEISQLRPFHIDSYKNVPFSFASRFYPKEFYWQQSTNKFNEKLEKLRTDKLATRGFGLTQRLVDKLFVLNDDFSAVGDPDKEKQAEGLGGIDNFDDDCYSKEISQLITKELIDGISKQEIELQQVGRGFLVPIKFVRAAEQYLARSFSRIFKLQGLARSPKVVILINQNKRGQQFIDELRGSNSVQDLALSSYVNQSTKKVKISMPTVWSEELKVNDIMVMHCTKFFHLLVHGDLSFSDFDILVFDQAESAFPEHPYNQIMSLYYNHNLQGNQSLPLIVSFFNITSVLNLHSDKQEVLFKIKTMCNMFNSKLVVLNNDQASNVQQQLYHELYEMTFSHLKIFEFFNVYRQLLDFNTLMMKYLFNIKIEPSPHIFQHKLLQQHHYFITSKASGTTVQILKETGMKESYSVLYRFWLFISTILLILLYRHLYLN